MTNTQEHLARFILTSHSLQRPDSFYFSEEGGIPLTKLVQNLNIAEELVLSDANLLVNSNDLERINRKDGTIAFRATAQLATTLTNIDNTKKEEDLARLLPDTRQDAIAKISIQSAEAMQWRALVQILLEELNNLRQWDSTLKAQIALATSLADLKTRVGALPAMPDRTFIQFKNAFINKINNGLADT